MEWSQAEQAGTLPLTLRSIGLPVSGLAVTVDISLTSTAATSASHLSVSGLQ